MATYNGAKYVVEQLESFASQTRLPNELIVSDDGSSDDTVALIESFRDRAPFKVRILHNPVRSGHAQNFANALSHCTGDLICISDQDDVWKNNKLEWVEDVAKRRPHIECFLNDATLTDARLNPTDLTKRGQLRNQNQPDHEFVLGCCLTIRSNILPFVLPIPNAVHAHDMWILSIYDLFGKVHRSNRILQYYRRHDDNVSKIETNNLRPARKMRASNLMRRLRAFRTSEALDYEFRRTQALLDRLKALGHAAFGIDKTDWSSILSRLQERNAVLERRLKMRSHSLAKRVCLLGGHLKLLRTVGVLGIVKDLVAAYSPHSLADLYAVGRGEK